MKRNESLIPLTHDHHHGLAQARRLRVASREEPKERARQAREFLSFYESDAVVHFRQEEEVIFPLVVDQPEAEGLLTRLMFEHLQIHALVRRVRADLSGGDVSPQLMMSMGEMLEAHIRLEEREAFPLIERLAAHPLDDVSLPPRNRREGTRPGSGR